MARTPGCDKSGLRKGTWTPEEDEKLKAYVTRYGCWNWRQLPKFAGLQRCGKSCRLRWLNYLRPNIKRGDYSKEEEETIIRLHEKLGNRWSAIAAELPGRTDNEVKNHWHTNLKKRFNHNPLEPKEHKRDTSSKDKEDPPLILVSQPASSDQFSSITKDESSNKACDADSGNFWAEPFFCDNFNINTLDSSGYEFAEFPFLCGEMDFYHQLDGFYF
ncbi:hypothetical protein GQ457_17G005140 [Hibiscus cannabinus]